MFGCLVDLWRALFSRPPWPKVLEAGQGPHAQEPIGLERLHRMSLMEWVNHHHYVVLPRTCTWRGVRTLKNPLDCWIYQEIIAANRPDLIVEIGIKNGGSTLMLADFCDLVGHGRVIGIDVDLSFLDSRVAHDRVTLIEGRSDDPAVVARVIEQCAGQSVMVIQDGAHDHDAVLADLRTYGALVGEGQYFIVEDTVDDLRGFGGLEPGVGVGGRIRRLFREDRSRALAAVSTFLAESTAFSLDRTKERYILTTNVKGYLRKKVATGTDTSSG